MQFLPPLHIRPQDGAAPRAEGRTATAIYQMFLLLVQPLISSRSEMRVGLKVAPLLQALGPWTLALGLSAGPGPWQRRTGWAWALAGSRGHRVSRPGPGRRRVLPAPAWLAPGSEWGVRLSKGDGTQLILLVPRAQGSANTPRVPLDFTLQTTHFPGLVAACSDRRKMGLAVRISGDGREVSASIHSK